MTQFHLTNDLDALLSDEARAARIKARTVKALVDLQNQEGILMTTRLVYKNAAAAVEGGRTDAEWIDRKDEELFELTYAIARAQAAKNVAETRKLIEREAALDAVLQVVKEAAAALAR